MQFIVHRLTVGDALKWIERINVTKVGITVGPSGGRIRDSFLHVNEEPFPIRANPRKHLLRLASWGSVGNEASLISWIAPLLLFAAIGRKHLFLGVLVGREMG